MLRWPLLLLVCAEELPMLCPFPPSLSPSFLGDCCLFLLTSSYNGLCPPLPFGRCGCAEPGPFITLEEETVPWTLWVGDGGWFYGWNSENWGGGEAVQWVDSLWEGRKSMSSLTSSLACFMTLFLKFQHGVKNRNPRIKYFGLSSFGMNYFCQPQTWIIANI